MSSPEALALQTLELTEKDLKIIEEEKLGTREYIRKKIEDSSPSFGRFLSQAYLYYDTKKSKVKNPDAWSKVEDVKSRLHQAGITNPETLTEEEVFSVVTDLHLLHKYKHKGRQRTTSY